MAPPWPCCSCHISDLDSLGSKNFADTTSWIASNLQQHISEEGWDPHAGLEIVKQLVSPEHDTPRTKSRKARIFRCRLKGFHSQERVDETGSIELRNFVVKVVDKMYSDEAAREITNLKRLGFHRHTVVYLGDFSDDRLRPNLLLFPAACCDLADLMAHVSRMIQNMTHEKNSVTGDRDWKPGTCHLLDDGMETTGSDYDLFSWPLNQSPTCQLQGLLSFVPCLCSALRQVHKVGLCHRDIKPENILIDLNGQAILSDFGSARLTAELACNEPFTSIQDFVGFNKRYTAPEIYRFETAHTESCDVFSLGIIITEILTLTSLQSLADFDNFRLQGSASDTQSKQPGYAQTLERVQIWLKSLRVSSSVMEDKGGPGEGRERDSDLRGITSQVIDMHPDRRPSLTFLFRKYASILRAHDQGSKD
ncbi:hypothetical protein ACLX1H_008883 [Fusarium chlamydosporum]